MVVFVKIPFSFLQNGSISLHGVVMANITAQPSLALYIETTKGLFKNLIQCAKNLDLRSYMLVEAASRYDLTKSTVKVKKKSYR